MTAGIGYEIRPLMQPASQIHSSAHARAGRNAEKVIHASGRAETPFRDRRCVAIVNDGDGQAAGLLQLSPGLRACATRGEEANAYRDVVILRVSEEEIESLVAAGAQEIR